MFDGRRKTEVDRWNEKKVIVIVGPTCSGKTYLAIKLAEILNTEILSADSRQIYKLLNIGTAKPTAEELKNTKHHFFDFLNPDENYNVSKFEKDAEEIIDRLIIKNKIPVVAGGSGLYIKALIDGIFDTADKDEEYRNELLRKRKEFGNELLYEELKKVDPVSAEKMLPQNWKRVLRALEVLHTTGEPIWKHHQKQAYSKGKKYNFIQFGLNWGREPLYENINRRVDLMIEKGLVEEVKNILSLGYNENLNSLNTVGYKEIISYLKDEITLDKAVQLIKRNTRHYAKRQLTWFRKDKRIKWFDVESANDLDLIAEEIVKGIKI